MKTYGQYIRINENDIRELDPFVYIEFYEANIHPYDEFLIDEKPERIYQGITAKEFFQQYKDGFLHFIRPILDDKRLDKLQSELENEGKQICMFNMFILATFLTLRGKSRYVFLLKPQIKDTLTALNKVNKITFTNEDGSCTESSSRNLIKEVINALEAKKDSDKNRYEIEKVVTWDKVSNNSIMQSYFVHDMTVFLNRYFPLKRKKDAQISTKEVELILYLMKLLKLSKEELTNKRYWQLMKIYTKISQQVTDIGRFTIKGQEMLIPMIFIPYNIWSKGKIDWTEYEMPGIDLKEGTTIQF